MPSRSCLVKRLRTPGCRASLRCCKGSAAPGILQVLDTRLHLRWASRAFRWRKASVVAAPSRIVPPSGAPVSPAPDSGPASPEPPPLPPLPVPHATRDKSARNATGDATTHDQGARAALCSGVRRVAHRDAPWGEGRAWLGDRNRCCHGRGQPGNFDTSDFSPLERSKGPDRAGYQGLPCDTVASWGHSQSAVPRNACLVMRASLSANHYSASVFVGGKPYRSSQARIRARLRVSRGPLPDF